MTLKTSTHFASAWAEGTDWRDTAKTVLEKLETIRTEGDGFSLGFLYITDDLADDAAGILNLFKSVTGIDNWLGCSGIGVCANGECFLNKTAIVVMIAKIPEDDFWVTQGTTLGLEQSEKNLKPWMDDNQPFCMIAHGDPMADENPAHDLSALAEMTESFLVGGLSSSRSAHVQFANDIVDNGVSGILLNQSVGVVTGLSQGCKPISEAHSITQAHDNTIMELDNKPAFQVFTEDVRDYAKAHIDNPQGEERPSLGVSDIEDIIAPVKEMFQGDIHMAIPIQGSDQKDFMVRNIAGLDPENGWISIGQPVTQGDKVMFVRRNHDSVEEDLSKTLLNLRKRFHNDYGEADPKGALYISCVARAGQRLSTGRADIYSDQSPTNEMELIQEIIGDIPIIGYYASGEISNARLYGYTGILILFN